MVSLLIIFLIIFKKIGDEIIVKPQEQLQQARDEIAINTQRLDLAIKASKIGIWDWDIEKNNLIWDNQMYKLYGIDKNKFTNAYESWLKSLHPDDKERSEIEVQNALTKNKELDTEFKILKANGEIRNIRALGTTTLDSEGHPLRMTGVNWDITNEKKVEADISDSTVEEINFPTIVNEIIDSLKLSFDDKLEYKINISANNKVRCQTTRVIQVLTNLISNAIKYQDKDKPQNYVSINISDYKEGAQIIVEDNGLGIPEEYHKKVFSMFERFHPNISFGSGLGMSIIKKHIDALGGEIIFTSSKDGSKFTLTIPNRS